MLANEEQHAKVPWAALGIGFSGNDWVAEWLSCLARADLPGADFVLLTPSADLSSFKGKIAKYDHFSNMMRVLLSTPPNPMDPRSAMQYTPHSWRHLYPTVGRQLQLPDATLDEVGHWECGSEMPKMYDSTACVSELLGKSRIANAVAKGWRPVEAGCIPAPEPASFAVSIPSAPRPTRVASRLCEVQKKRKVDVPVDDVEILPKGRQVLNKERSVIHLYLLGTCTLCKLWKCGSPDEPAASAEFRGSGCESGGASENLQLCKRCMQAPHESAAPRAAQQLCNY